MNTVNQNPGKPSAAVVLYPINERIVNGRVVTIQVIGVNGARGDKIMPLVQRAVKGFRTFVSGEVHIVESPPLQAELDRRKRIAPEQYQSLLARRPIVGPSVITVFFGPWMAWPKAPFGLYTHDGANGGIVWLSILRPGLGLARMVLKFLLGLPIRVFSLPGWFIKAVILHELCHSLGVPRICDEGHHCSSRTCILNHPRTILERFGQLLRPWWTHSLCPRCLQELADARQSAGGRLIEPDAPCDPMERLDQMVALNPDNPLERLYHAEALAKLGRWAQAVDDYDRALALGAGPKEGLARCNRAVALWHLGRFADCLAGWEECLRLDEQHRNALYNLARLLATCPSDPIRDGTRAVELTNRLCDLAGWANERHRALLASAHAEAGQFDRAIEHQQAAMSLCKPSRREDLAKNLELYQAGRPLRTSPSDGSSI